MAATPSHIYKCISLNVNSLISLSRRHELDLFLKKHKPHFVLIQEHKLNNRHNVSFQNYNLIRDVSGKAAIIIRSDIAFTRQNFQNNLINHVTITISLSNSTSLTLASVYNPIDNNICSTDIENFIHKIQSFSDFIIGGDWNAHHSYWGSPNTSTRGRHIMDMLNRNPHFLVHASSLPSRGANFIDFFITSPSINTIGYDLNGSCNYLASLDGNSDHKAIVLNFSAVGYIETEPIKYRDMENADFTSINNFILNNFNHYTPINNGLHLNEYVEALTTTINEATNLFVPEIISKQKGLLTLSPDIIKLIKTKKTLRRKLYRTSDNQRRNILKVEIKLISILIHDKIILDYKKQLSNLEMNIGKDSSLFQKIKRLCLSRKKTDLSFISVPNQDNLPEDILDQKRLNLLAKNFTSVPDQTQDDTQLLSEINLSIHNIVNSNTVIQRTTCEDEIEQIIINLNSKKSAGFDNISNYLIKRIKSSIISPMCRIINSSFELGHYPTFWKTSKTHPISKGDTNAPSVNNFRPISLLSNLSKILERVLYNTINNFAEENNLLQNFQFGFRKSLSTIHALTKASSFISGMLNISYPAVMVTLDFSRAFDTVWHQALVHKLHTYGLDNNTCRLLNDYLSNRSCIVNINNLHSDEFLVKAGVPQGSLLGPLLYNLYLADIPHPPDGVEIIIYADDILLLSGGLNGNSVNRLLNSYLDVLNKYFIKWRLTLNKNKCETLCIKGLKKFLSRGTRKYEPEIKIDNHQICNKQHIKYLGITFDSKYNFIPHLKHTKNRALKVFHMFSRGIRVSSKIQKNVKLLWYKQVIRPILAYGFPIWYCISKNQLQSLKCTERSFLRACTGMRKVLHPTLGVYVFPSNNILYNAANNDILDEFLFKIAINYSSSCAYNDHQVVRDMMVNSSRIRTPLEDIYLSPMHIQHFINCGKFGHSFYENRKYAYSRSVIQ